MHIKIFWLHKIPSNNVDTSYGAAKNTHFLDQKCLQNMYKIHQITNCLKF